MRRATRSGSNPDVPDFYVVSNNLKLPLLVPSTTTTQLRIATMDRFKNLTFSQAQMPQTSAMTSYLSNILTTATSKANNLRRALISSEADGDTEDDSHIARVLRAYYTEKGRMFPEWLPPDPKAPPPPPPTQMISSSGAQMSGYGGYGQPQPAASRWGRGGGLSDLWDSGSKAQQQEDTTTLRARPGFARANVSNYSDSTGSRASGRLGNSLEEPAQARPLPSQRAGSYQTQFSQSATTLRPSADTSPPPSSGGGSTAQERLKQRLWGARSNSPTPTSSNASSLSQSTSPAPARNPYAEPESRYSAPVRANDDGGYGSGGGGGRFGGGAGAASKPFVSANAPWSGNDDPYAPPSGGGYSGGGGYGGGPYARSGGGLPSGPRAPRQGGVGLPSGPRPQR